MVEQQAQRDATDVRPCAFEAFRPEHFRCATHEVRTVVLRDSPFARCAVGEMEIALEKSARLLEAATANIARRDAMPGANAALIAEAREYAKSAGEVYGTPYSVMFGKLADALAAAESRAQANAAALADEIAAVVIGGAGARRVCDGPGAYMAECGPTYDDIFNAHRELERICDAALREGEATHGE